jgi:hypothetical protein
MLEGAKDACCSDVPSDAFHQLEAMINIVRADLNRLHNGLDDKDNRELMLTSDLGKVVRLVTKGLSKLGYMTL